MASAIASNGRQYLDAVVAIDIGSTETRVVAAWHDGANIRKRFILNRRDIRTSLNTSTQFSSRVLVHDDNPNKYLGNAIQDHREESSAKFIPYILTTKNEKFLDQYPLLERLWDERKKVGRQLFQERLEEAFNQFLCFVLKRTKCALETYSSEGKQIRIKLVAMTIPSQWDLNFEEVYRRMFKRAFLQTFDKMPEVAPHDFAVVFYTEATALAQYIFHESSHGAALGGGMPMFSTILGKPNAQCSIDCGGHNSNSTVTQFYPDSNGQPVLYELVKPQGAGGGSEMWIHDVLNQLIEQYRLHYNDNDETEFPQWFYQTLKQDITSKLQVMTEGASKFVTCKHPRGLNDLVTLKLTGEMSEKAFQVSFKHVKAMIESQLQELARIRQGWGATDHIVTVIVCGGSSMHLGFTEWITALCTKLSLPAPVFVSWMETITGPARIALGAAYASLASESVASFAEKCAFGLQRGIVKNQGKKDEYLDLEGSAATIWYQERGVVPRTFDARGDQEEYRIVCKPFLDFYRDQLPTDGDLAQQASYDFLNIGTLPGSFKHRIEFMLDTKNEQIELKIHSIVKPLSDKLKNYTRSVARKGKVLSLGPFPVHIQPGTRCLVIQKSTDEIDEAIVTAIENYRDDWGYDDTDCDETYRDDPLRDDTESSDTDSDEDYNDDADNAIVSGSTRPSQSCSLGNSHDGPIPVLRRSISPCPQYSGGDNETAQGNDKSGEQNDPADVAQQAAATSNTAASSASENRNESSATNASTSTSMTSSPGRGCIASKAVTARAASHTFRPSRQVSGRVASSSQTGNRVPQGISISMPTARPGGNGGHIRSENVPRTGDTSSSSYPGSSFLAPGFQGGLSARNKRPAPTEGDNRRPTKRIHTGGDGAADCPSERASRPGPVGNPVTSYPAAENSASFENRRNSPARRGYSDYYRPSANTVRFPRVATPPRRPGTAWDYSSSNRYRDRDSESSVHHGMAGLNLNQGMPASGSPPRGPTVPAPRQQGTTAPSTTPASSSGPSSRPPHINSPSPHPGSSYRPARNPGPSGTSQQRPGFNGQDPVNRRTRPPWRH